MSKDIGRNKNWINHGPLHPKGNQSWIFIGRTDVEAETPILWLPDVKNWLIGKDPDAGEDWRQEEKGTIEDEMVGWHHWLEGHVSEQFLGLVNEQDCLVCCIPLGHSQTWLSNWTNAPNSNVNEAEVELFCDDLENLLEQSTTTTKMSF